jgi:hypothetical protein
MIRFCIALIILIALPLPAASVEVPAEGQCPPYPVKSEDGTEQAEDVVPPAFRAGQTIELEGLERLQDYLPREIWEHRHTFFHEGMVLEIGPCHRRYPVPPFFEQATGENAQTARIDDAGNLQGYSGTGLPFPWQDIPDDAKSAGWKWAWNYRYRYQGAGFRGDFRILVVAPRARKIDRFEGRFYLLPRHGLPGLGVDPGGARFWAGGEFTAPASARGVAWQQIHPAEADQKPQRSDELFIWLPEERRVRRGAPVAVDGIFLPSYQRTGTANWGRMQLPDGTQTPDASIAVTEHSRRGFTGLLLRPNAYYFGFLRTQDVIAPINTRAYGYPTDKERSYGPSGLSPASDRWEIRRAVVLKGLRKKIEGRVASVTLYIDALTQQPLYYIARKVNGHLAEVGILMGRFSGDDPLQPEWEGGNREFGVILPVGASFYVTGEGGWLRESFEVLSNPPTEDEESDLTTTIKLQRGH